MLSQAKTKEGLGGSYVLSLMEAIPVKAQSLTSELRTKRTWKAMVTEGPSVWLEQTVTGGYVVVGMVAKGKSSKVSRIYVKGVGELKLWAAVFLRTELVYKSQALKTT